MINENQNQTQISVRQINWFDGEPCLVYTFPEVKVLWGILFPQLVLSIRKGLEGDILFFNGLRKIERELVDLALQDFQQQTSVYLNIDEYLKNEPCQDLN